MLKYFRPITHKKDAPKDKDPPEGKELSVQSILAIFIKSYTPAHRYRYQLLAIATCIYNADITRVLKQAKRSFTSNCYTKLTQSSTEM